MEATFRIPVQVVATEKIAGGEAEWERFRRHAVPSRLRHRPARRAVELR